MRNPEYADEPACLEEWQEADDSIMVIGHGCLCRVQASLHAYLTECIGRLGSLWWDWQNLQNALAHKKGMSWFDRYRLLFLEELRIDWSTSPVALADLEQLNLTRNDLIHNVDMVSFSIERGEDHAQRFPRALFTDGLWASVGTERIRVTRDKLELGIPLVKEFCSWVDDVRGNYSRR